MRPRRSGLAILLVAAAAAAAYACSSDYDSTEPVGADAAPDVQTPGDDGSLPAPDDAGASDGEADADADVDCGDLQTSSLNCGACGNVCPATTTCAGAQCRCGEAGAGPICASSTGSAVSCGAVTCAVRTPLSPDPNISRIALGDTDVFYVTSSISEYSLKRVPKTGGAPVLMYDAGAAEIRQLVANVGKVVFALSTGEIMTCADTGCGAAPTVLVTGQPATLALTMRGGKAYWTAGLEVRTCTLTGCGGVPTTVATLPAPDSGPVQATSLAVDTTGIYVSYQSFLAVAPFAGGTLVTLATGDTQPFALDDTNAYFTKNSAIVRCAKAGCGNAPTTISPTLAFPTGHLVTDGASVYLADPYNSGMGAAIRTVPVGGAGSFTNVDDLGLGVVRGPLAIDATRLYFTGAPNISSSRTLQSLTR